MSTVSGSGSSDTPNPPTLQDRIEAVIQGETPHLDWCQECAGFRETDQGSRELWIAHVADAVTQLLIDMAGHSELLASIDRMYR